MFQEKVAILGNEGEYTIFSYQGEKIRFRTSSHLERYTKIIEWDNGYLAVMAKYDNNVTEEEEYIDIRPILRNLLIDAKEFLAPIKNVEVRYV